MNGIDIQIYKPFSCDRNKTIGISDETFVIGMFARYARQKDHETFFKSLAHLSLTMSCFHVILAGHGINRDNIELEQLLEKYRLSSHVSLLGERQDLPCLYNSIDVHVLSSSYGEACPLVVQEAMSCGVPCISTDVGDSALLIGSEGWVAERFSFTQLSSFLFEAYNLSKDHSSWQKS